ncbi:MAG TPA: amidase family protein, partial [Candidatus Thermoplasmatota archaeon]|nr:amidase family protein [Candidatus Thermoplasmatota archaeon]
MTIVARVEAALERLGEDPWNAFLDVDRDGALARARALDLEGPRGRPLFGVVASVKDNLAVAGRRMTCGSRHLGSYTAPYTATAVCRLEAAGAVVLGKTNMDEFAAGSSGENSAFGPTRNPRDPARVPGGSSSGAAASVAAGVCDLALGSDTGGSVRCPGSFCGVPAIKPSYGVVPRHGLADLAMSLESPAPLARDVRTLAATLAAISGPDPRDPTARHALEPPDLARGARGLTLGVVREFFEGVEPETATPVRAALDRLEAAGAKLVDISVPETREGLAAYYLVNYVEFASAMQRFDGFRYGTPALAEGRLEDAVAAARATFGREVRRRILLGTYASEQEH